VPAERPPTDALDLDALIRSASLSLGGLRSLSGFGLGGGLGGDLGG
jgi:hypothetical protein